jgi:dolichol kinase
MDLLVTDGIVLIVLVILFQIVATKLQFITSSEGKRRIQHAMTGHVLVQISYYLPIHICIILLTIASMYLYYICTYQFETVYLKYFGPLLRPAEIEEKQFPGALYFLIGTTITALVFPIHIARYSVECLAFADPIAAYVGQTIASPKILPLYSSASVSGSFACFLSAWLIGYVMLETTTETYLFVITAGALTCCIAEAIPVFGNDNLQVPILTALAATIMSKLTTTAQL